MELPLILQPRNFREISLQDSFKLANIKIEAMSLVELKRTPAVNLAAVNISSVAIQI
jgi:hypothetical protein